MSKLVALLCAFLLGCAQVGAVSYLMIQAQSLALEAQQLEDIVLSAEMDEGDRAAFDRSIRAIRLHVEEIQRYDNIASVAQVDLKKLERNYLSLRVNLSLVISVLSEEDVWSSFNEFEQEQLKLFYRDLVDLSEEIEEFRNDDQGSLEKAAKITAFSSVAVKVLLKVAEVYL